MIRMNIWVFSIIKGHFLFLYHFVNSAFTQQATLPVFPWIHSSLYLPYPCFS